MVVSKTTKNTKWNFAATTAIESDKKNSGTVREYLNMINSGVDKNNGKSLVPLGQGDPSGYPCFRTTVEAEQGMLKAVSSWKFNGYAPTAGIHSARW